MGRNATTGLTWRESDGRWMKKYQGRYFYFSAGRNNKTRSEPQAKAAFRAWKLQVDQEIQQQQQDNPSYEQRLRNYWQERLSDLQGDLRQHFVDSTEVRDFWRVMEMLKRVSPYPQTGIKEYDADPALESIVALIEPAIQKLGRVMAETKPTDTAKIPKPKGIAPWEEITADDKPQTIGSLVETFLANQKQAAEVGEISASRYDKLRVNMKKFLDSIDPDMPTSKLDNALLNNWRSIVSKQVADGVVAPVTGRDYLAITKRFVNFAYNRGYLDVMPRCLTARGQDSFTIAVKRKEIVTAEVSDVHRLLEVAGSKAKLVILLGLNCGYGPRDISGILKSEIDFKKGTLTRSRTKTSKRDKPTVVCFKLWPETIKAIRDNLSDHPSLAFTTEAGNPLVNEIIGSDGIVKRHDAVHSIWFRVSKHAKVDTKLRQLRKLGATILKRGFPYFVDHYLSHAAGRVSDQHYAATHQAGFDEALMWLRSEVLPKEVLLKEAS